MWVEELSDAVCPLGGFTRVCNECDSCRIDIHHSDFFWHVFFFLPSRSHSVCAGCGLQGHRHKSLQKLLAESQSTLNNYVN